MASNQEPQNKAPLLDALPPIPIAFPVEPEPEFSEHLKKRVMEFSDKVDALILSLDAQADQKKILLLTEVKNNLAKIIDFSDPTIIDRVCAEELSVNQIMGENFVKQHANPQNDKEQFLAQLDVWIKQSEEELNKNELADAYRNILGMDANTFIKEDWLNKLSKVIPFDPYLIEQEDIAAVDEEQVLLIQQEAQEDEDLAEAIKLSMQENNNPAKKPDPVVAPKLPSPNRIDNPLPPQSAAAQVNFNPDTASPIIKAPPSPEGSVSSLRAEYQKRSEALLDLLVDEKEFNIEYFKQADQLLQNILKLDAIAEDLKVKATTLQKQVSFMKEKTDTKHLPLLTEALLRTSQLLLNPLDAECIKKCAKTQDKITQSMPNSINKQRLCGLIAVLGFTAIALGILACVGSLGLGVAAGVLLMTLGTAMAVGGSSLYFFNKRYDDKESQMLKGLDSAMLDLYQQAPAARPL